MTSVLGDIKHAFRLIARSPGFALAVVVTLALGIGANSAIFSVVRAVVLRPLPYADADRLVVGRGSMADLDDVIAASPALAAATVTASNLYDLPPDELGDAEQVRGDIVTPSFFDVLGVAPALGSTFTRDTDAQPLALLGDRLWRSRFHADRSVVGKTITLGGRVHTIVGVMPPSFRLPSPQTMVWVTMGSAMATSPQQPHDRSFRIFRMIARLGPGASLSSAQAQATAVMQRLAHDFPDTNKDVPLTLQPLRNQLLGTTPEILWLLFGAVALVLLIACANVASLSLARTSTRGRELAVRIALGARPARIVRQLLTESLVLSLIGGGLGLLLALWGVDGLKLIGPRDVPRLDEVGVDGTVLAVGAALSIASALLFGLLPAWMASRGRFGEVVHGARGVTASRGSSRLHGALVVVEVALSLVLLIAASLCLRSFARLTSVPLGLQPEHALTFMMSPTPRHTGPGTAAAAATFYQQALDRIAAQPGVDAVGGANAQPPSTLQRLTGFAIGDEPATGGGDRNAAFIGSTPDYFRALGTTVVRGRAFTVDDRAAAPLVVILNRSLANRLYPHGDAVGQKLRLVSPTQPPAPRTIVGVVDDVKYQGLDMDSPDTIYTPYAQTPFPWIYAVARTRGDPLALASAVKRAVAELDPAQPVCAGSR